MNQLYSKKVKIFFCFCFISAIYVTISSCLYSMDSRKVLKFKLNISTESVEGADFLKLTIQDYGNNKYFTNKKYLLIFLIDTYPSRFKQRYRGEPFEKTETGNIYSSQNDIKIKCLSDRIVLNYLEGFKTIELKPYIDDSTYSVLIPWHEVIGDDTRRINIKNDILKVDLIYTKGEKKVIDCYMSR